MLQESNLPSIFKGMNLIAKVKLTYKKLFKAVSHTVKNDAPQIGRSIETEKKNTIQVYKNEDDLPWKLRAVHKPYCITCS